MTKLINEFKHQLVTALLQARSHHFATRQSMQVMAGVAAILAKLKVNLTQTPVYKDSTSASLVAPPLNLTAEILPMAANNPGIPLSWQPMVQSLLALAPELSWYQRQPTQGEGPYLEPFASSHANAYIIGPQGLQVRHDVAVGITLVASDITYVDHQHPPEEVYLVLSPGCWRQEQGPWLRPNPGGFIYNSANIIHSMKSGSAPLFAIWCLNLEA